MFLVKCQFLKIMKILSQKTCQLAKKSLYLSRLKMIQNFKMSPKLSDCNFSDWVPLFLEAAMLKTFFILQVASLTSWTMRVRKMLKMKYPKRLLKLHQQRTMRMISLKVRFSIHDILLMMSQSEIS